MERIKREHSSKSTFDYTLYYTFLMALNMTHYTSLCLTPNSGNCMKSLRKKQLYIFSKISCFTKGAHLLHHQHQGISIKLQYKERWSKKNCPCKIFQLIFPFLFNSPNLHLYSAEDNSKKQPISVQKYLKEDTTTTR